MNLDVFPDRELLENSGMVIVDIRTEAEWKLTGIVPGSHCITFFDSFGNYDVEAFKRSLEPLGGKEKEIGLICRTGARTHQAAHMLAHEGYNVKNLAGGVLKLRSEGYKLSPYRG